MILVKTLQGAIQVRTTRETHAREAARPPRKPTFLRASKSCGEVEALVEKFRPAKEGHQRDDDVSYTTSAALTVRWLYVYMWEFGYVLHLEMKDQVQACRLLLHVEAGLRG